MTLGRYLPQLVATEIRGSLESHPPAESTQHSPATHSGNHRLDHQESWMREAS